MGVKDNREKPGGGGADWEWNNREKPGGGGADGDQG